NAGPMAARSLIGRLYARAVNDNRKYPEFTWRWLNQFSTGLFWKNPGALIRPQYAWGVAIASAQARALGHKEISVLEFGVAGGRGLVALEQIVQSVSAVTGVAVRIFGFDL